MRTYWLKDPSVEAELFDTSEEMAQKYKAHDLRKAHEELKSGIDINGFWIPWDQKYWIIKYPTGETDVMNDDKFQQLYAKDSFLEGLRTDFHQVSDELEHIKSDYWKKIAENDQLRSENIKLKKKRAADDFAVYFFNGIGFGLLIVIMTLVWDWILS